MTIFHDLTFLPSCSDSHWSHGKSCDLSWLFISDGKKGRKIIPSKNCLMSQELPHICHDPQVVRLGFSCTPEFILNQDKLAANLSRRSIDGSLKFQLLSVNWRESHFSHSKCALLEIYFIMSFLSFKIFTFYSTS